MIQDIYPHVYNNAFTAHRAPRAEDLVLIYKGSKILSRLEEDKIFYPSVKMILDSAGDPEEKMGSMDPAEPLLRSDEGQDESSADSLQASGPLIDEQTEKRASHSRDGEAGRYLRRGIRLIYLFSIDDRAFYGIDRKIALPEGYDFEPLTVLRSVGPGAAAFAGITGAQLSRWRKDRRYCGRCGEKMRPSTMERAFICSACGAVVYPKISPAVIVAVIDKKKDRLLLTKYAGRRYANYALVAGFAEIGETIEETVHREVMEEVGLKVTNLRFYKSQPWSFSDTLLMGFFCELEGDEDITLDKDELAVGEWHSREEMPVRENEISLTAEMMERFRLGLE